MQKPRILLAIGSLVFLARGAYAATPALGEYASHAQDGRACVVTTTDGQKLRLTPYGDAMVRVQSAAAGQPFTPDDHYAMVLKHDWPGQLAAQDAPGLLTLTGAKLAVAVSK